MNYEHLKKQMDDFFKSVPAEYLIDRLKEMGYEFEKINTASSVSVASKNGFVPEWEIQSFEYNGTIYELMDWRKYSCYTQPTFQVVNGGSQLSQEYAFAHPKCSINSVRRLSDNTTWTIGETIAIRPLKKEMVIDSFEIVNGFLYANPKGKTQYCEIHHWTKAPAAEKNKEWEITKFSCKIGTIRQCDLVEDGKFINNLGNTQSLFSLIEDKSMCVSAIRRLKDNVVFSVGDWIDVGGKTMQISEIWLPYNDDAQYPDVRVFCEDKWGWSALNSACKAIPSEKKPTWEILTFNSATINRTVYLTGSSGAYAINVGDIVVFKSLEEVLKLEGLRISKVRRLSDKTDFSIGDYIICKTSHVKEAELITCIELNKDGNIVLFTKSFCKHGVNLMKVQKEEVICKDHSIYQKSNKVVLITKDKVEITDPNQIIFGYSGVDRHLYINSHPAKRVSEPPLP